MLADMEKRAKKESEYMELYQLHSRWVEVVGASAGTCRLGFFNWARFEQVFTARTGSSNQIGKVLVTRKEFLAKMIEKGKSESWAIDEWNRRQLDPVFKKDVCPDTGLPTTQMHEGPREIDFCDKMFDKRVVMGTKTKRCEGGRCERF